MRENLVVVKYEIIKLLIDKQARRALILFPVFFALVSVFSSLLTTNTEYGGEYHVYFLDMEVDEYQTELTKEVTVSVSSLELGTFEEFRTSEFYGKKNLVVEAGENNITIYYDASDAMGSALKEYVRTMLEQLEFERLKSLLGDSKEIKEIRMENIGQTRDLMKTFASMIIPFMFILTLNSDCLSFVSDKIAGERERGVFEKLLITPVKSEHILVDKIIANSLTGLFSSGLYFMTLIATGALMTFSGKLDLGGAESFNISKGGIALFIAGAMLLSILYSNIGILCSLLGKTTREVRNYILVINFITYAAAFFSIYRIGNQALSYYAIPVYNFCLLFQDAIRGNYTLAKMVMALGSTVVLFILCLWLERKALKKILCS